MLLPNERQQVVNFCQKIAKHNLTPGTTGNISTIDRERGLIAISPSGIAYEDLNQSSVVVMDLQGDVIQGKHKPSSEWPFHLQCYLNRSDVKGVIHTHSVYATTFACLNIDIEPVHYMIGFAGTKVPCVEYARPGSQELADKIKNSISEYNALLMANHGLLTLGPSLESAFLTLEQVEFTAEIYFRAKSIGDPSIISDQEMLAIMEHLKVYGKED